MKRWLLLLLFLTTLTRLTAGCSSGELTVTDSLLSPTKMRHFGLLRIREWAELIGALFEISSTPGERIRLVITLLT